MNGKSKIVYIFNESHYLGNLHFTASLKTLLFSGFIVCVNVDLFLSLSLSSPLLEAYFQERERQESAEMTRLFITGLLRDLCA